MSVETKQDFPTPKLDSGLKDLKQMDVLVQPDPGGTYKPDFSFENTIIIAQPMDRILPNIEPQEQVINRPLDNEKYLADVARLQRIFNRTLGIRVDEAGEIRNYNPVLARAMYEQLETEEERARFHQYEVVQVETALKERYHAAEGTAVYSIDASSRLRSRDLPLEAFDSVLARGVTYRKELGSPDSEREQAELTGFLKIQRKLADPATPLHSKMLVVSGPGTVAGTIYGDNFVDIYELGEEADGKRIVIMTRFASSADYEQYKEKITSLRPTYFNEAKGAVDAWFLANPVYLDAGIKQRSAGELFEQITGDKAGGMTGEKMREILEESKPRIGYLVEAIKAPVFNPKEIALAVNAVLKGAELAVKRLDRLKEKALESIAGFIERVPVFKNIVEEMAWLGRQIVEQIRGACGWSGSYSLGGIAQSIGGLVSRIAGGLSVGFSKDKDYCIHCGACGAEINCVVRKGEKCPKCPAIREC